MFKSNFLWMSGAINMQADYTDVPTQYDHLLDRTSTSHWYWLGTLNRNGYGYVRHNKRTCVPHRVIYELVVGPIPEGLVLDHLCRRRSCCNPAHLEPVTNEENIRRGEFVPKKQFSKVGSKARAKAVTNRFEAMEKRKARKNRPKKVPPSMTPPAENIPYARFWEQLLNK